MTTHSRFADIELADFDLSAQVAEPTAKPSQQIANVVDLSNIKSKQSQAVAFDYSGLSKAVVRDAEATAARIRDRLRANTIETGKELLGMKGKLGHGKFGKWLDFHFGWTERTAQNYMNSATAFGETPRVIDILPPSTVYKLAAKSTPEELRQSVIKEIELGETPDPKKIEKRLAEIKSEARRKVSLNEGGNDQNFVPSPTQASPDSETLAEIDDAITTSDLLKDADAIATEAPVACQPVAGGEGKAVLDPEDQEVRAKKVADGLKKALGKTFEAFRAAILGTDPSSFNKALRDI